MPRKTSKKTAVNPAKAAPVLRIIGGEWRSRKLSFPKVDGLRPTPDRVRETLFNWLQSVTPSARCLDLFAGSGALGLEALSRGAKSVTFIDQAPAAVSCLRDNLALLEHQATSPSSEVIAASALDWLTKQNENSEKTYDLVFLDPPFRKGWLEPICAQLEAKGLLAEGAAIYIEAETELSHLPVPPNWQEHRCKVAGQVTYRLYFRNE